MKPGFSKYSEIIELLKHKIRQARIQAVITVNAQMLNIYWEIGDTIAKQEQEEGWGKKIVETLAKDLKAEFPEMKGFSPRNIRYMRDFALAYPDFPILQAPPAKSEINEHMNNILILQAGLAKLTWYHHVTLLDKVKDLKERQFYIDQTAKNGWSRDVMVHQIESGLYKRQGQITSNFKHTIAPNQSELVQQLFKDPYKFDFIYLGQQAKERDLEDALTNQLTKFLIELGQWFAFMGRQYRVMVGDKEYFYDLLFYHTRLKRYIVIELKIDEFKPEYKGKMEYYLTIADEQLKSATDDPSIGLILCKTKDGLVAEYALRDSSKPIGIAEYNLSESLPENIKGELPSIEELEIEIEKGYDELKSPAEKRLEALKNKISQISGKEIMQTATTPILFEIIDSSIIPMYQSIIDRMDQFTDMFVSRSYNWQGKNKQMETFDQMAEEWKNEEFLKSNYDFYFSYHLNGFKKAGTEAFSSGFQLNFRIDTYWYGFTLINYNNQQPFIKKLYNEQLSKEDINQITDTISEFVIDNIERNLERMSDL
ncbi:hypothetical protein GCM10023093_21790 [Nemorincola caseinilytica]|uniref:DUF1016 domain-containing protein n=1 Tax=Nemorincola caseinilytica TaxID=2054315 RepID=A0ABP8NGE6_9BACT